MPVLHFLAWAGILAEDLGIVAERGERAGVGPDSQARIKDGLPGLSRTTRERRAPLRARG